VNFGTVYLLKLCRQSKILEGIKHLSL
jgi:hypothetical protein